MNACSHDDGATLEMITATFECLDGSTSSRNALRCKVCGELWIEETEDDPCPPEPNDESWLMDNPRAGHTRRSDQS